VIALDANLLIYAFDANAPEHARAQGWLKDVVESAATVGLPLVSILAFARIATDRRLSKSPKAIAVVIGEIQSLIERENVTVLQPTERHWPIFFELVAETRAGGPLVTDAHIAALAIEHGAALYTNDRDFRRFPKLDVRFPLAD
jgi:uncharacterized protein